MARTRMGAALAAGVAALAGRAAAQEEAGGERGLDAAINDVFEVTTGWYVELVFAPLPLIGVPWIVFWLVIAAFVLTYYFRGVQVWGVRQSIRLVRGKFSRDSDPGEVTHFQALATALSGTVGLGNIAGVAVAVSIGGPGATFWMILAGILGMATKFCECTLGVKYRNEYPDGTVSGGPMYYLKKGFDENGYRGGSILAVLFCLFTIGGALGGGNMFQANQAHAQLVAATGGADSFFDGRGWLTGLIMAVVVFAVIVGGIRSIARVTEKVVPFMGILYVVTALGILAVNIDEIGWAFGQIFAGAFTGLGVAGGMIGALIQGFRRAAFSNEAGIGSAAIAHSAVKTKEPVTEGLVALLEPFIDTVVVCTMTALVITISGVLIWDPETGRYVLNAAGDAIRTEGDLAGVELTSAAFERGLSWFPYVLSAAVVLFAFSTMLSWSYYGMKAVTYLVGESAVAEMIFKVTFCVFIVIGAAAQLGAVIGFSDAMLFSMAIANIIGLYALMPVVRKELNSYFDRLRSGEIRPVAEEDATPAE